MTLVCMMAVAVIASAQSVYISTGDGAVAYHKSKSCSYLTNSKSVKTVSTSEAKNLGRHECPRCYGTAAAAASKKAAEKKVKTTTTQARDEKGRFVKKAETEKATAKKTATQARDEKGRFVKKAETEKASAKKTATEKKATAKKTAETTKKSAETKAKSATIKKSAPARDEKGRFIKKTATEKKTKKAA